MTELPTDNGRHRIGDLVQVYGDTFGFVVPTSDGRLVPEPPMLYEVANFDEDDSYYIFNEGEICAARWTFHGPISVPAI